MTAQRVRELLLDRGGAVMLVAFAVYVAFACPYIVENDNAEFATLGAVGGVAHPSGFPLYVLWLRLFSWLPLDTPAHAAAIATAILGALSVLVLHAAARAWGARPLSASVAAGIFAMAPLVLRYHTRAEVFALNNLVVASVLWLAAIGGPVRGRWRAGALALVAGLGLANNLTCVLVAPVGVLGLVRAANEDSRSRALAFALGGLGLGLLPYAYVFVAPQTPASWQTPSDLGGLVDLFLRRAYGGVGATGFGNGDRFHAEQLGALAWSVGQAWLFVLPLVGAGALAYRIARPAAGGESRFGWAMLATTCLLAGPIFALLFDRGLDEIGTWHVRRLHVMPIALLTVPIAIGLDPLAARLGRARPALAQVLVLVVIAALGAARLPYLSRYSTPAMELEVRNTLESLPPRAVVFGSIDELDVGMRYLQLARGIRTDVLFVRADDLVREWYRARFSDVGLRFDAPAGMPLKIYLVEQVHAQGRPLFAGQGEGADLPGYVKVPYGVVAQVLPHGSPSPTIDEVVAANKHVFERFRLDYPFPGAHDDFATWVHRNYAGVWTLLSRALAANGERAAAEDASEIARQLAPR